MIKTYGVANTWYSIPLTTDDSLAERLNKHGWYLPENSGCWLWTTDGKYGRIAYKGTRLKAHRAAYMAWVGDPGELNVLHRCDNPPCINPAHLFLGTKEDNNKDRAAKGRSHRPSGSKNPNATICQDIADRIRELHAEGWTQRQLSNQYEVSQSTISSVLRGVTWADPKDLRTNQN